MLRTDYESHEELYGRRKGDPSFEGWSDEADAREKRVKLVRTLTSEAIPADGRVIDLGCGAGDYSVVLAERGYRVVGVDIAPTAIEWAREKAAAAGVEVDFRVGSVVTLEGISIGPSRMWRLRITEIWVPAFGRFP